MNSPKARLQKSTLSGCVFLPLTADTFSLTAFAPNSVKARVTENIDQLVLPLHRVALHAPRDYFGIHSLLF